MADTIRMPPLLVAILTVLFSDIEGATSRLTVVAGIGARRSRCTGRSAEALSRSMAATKPARSSAAVSRMHSADVWQAFGCGHCRVRTAHGGGGQAW